MSVSATCMVIHKLFVVDDLVRTQLDMQRLAALHTNSWIAKVQRLQHFMKPPRL